MAQPLPRLWEALGTGLNLIHLSDIHLGTNEVGKQFDRDAPLRGAILDSLDMMADNLGAFDAVLVTGDIAFSGHEDEYKRADAWLGEVCSRGRCSREAIFVVPGNHDVNRRRIAEGTALWAGHERIREMKDPEDRHGALRALLTDESTNAVGPLEEYCGFAQRYECQTTCENLAWSHVFDRVLADGTRVVLHGLNSAIISDSDQDAPGGLFVSEYQLGDLTPAPDVVRIVLCHHPPSWLVDKGPFQDILRNTTRVMLFGHEHEARVYRLGDTVQVCAGAVHPSRRESRWTPCYHMIQLDVERLDGRRRLKTRVHTMEWRPANHRFDPALSSAGTDFEEFLFDLPDWEAPRSPQAQGVDSGAPSSEAAMTASNDAAASKPGARRLLVVHFFGLGTPARYNIATALNLLREGDDQFKGHELWSKVLDRAHREGKLAQLWQAVAEKDPDLGSTTNPFQD